MEIYYGEHCKMTTKPITVVDCSMCLKVYKIKKLATYECSMTSGLGLQTHKLCQSCVNWTIQHHQLKKK